MSARRPLGEMLGEIASGALDALCVAPQVGINRITITLPLELQLREAGGQVQVLGDLPRLVTRTAFDLRPGRIEVVWERTKPS
jgi:hypothetical protein